MVIEFLTFEVAPEEQDAWLPIEEQTWSRYLEQRPGFVRKEIWKNRDNPAEIHSVIWWSDQDLWFAITREEVEAVDASMGSWFREATSMRIFDVIRES